MTDDERSMIHYWLAMAVRTARDTIPTEPEHAIPNHRADEYLRDQLEDLLHVDNLPGKPRLPKRSDTVVSVPGPALIAALRGEGR